jgi:hypothetical protein
LSTLNRSLREKNEEWKALGKRFNLASGLSTSIRWLPLLAKPQIFVNRLEEATSDSRTFTTANYAKALAADIIIQPTVERDLQAQSTPEDKVEKGPFWHSDGVPSTLRTFFQDWLRS